MFLGGVVGSVLMSGMVDLGEINILGIHRAIQDWLRDGLLLLLGVASLITTPIKLREDNEFTWFPIIEVAYLFIGIFITMIPCLLILKAGTHGELAFLINLVEKPYHYFWVTGLLSSFLDNAPTYLTFFNTALGSFYSNLTEAQAVPLLMTEKAIYLKAISAGAVFFGRPDKKYPPILHASAKDSAAMTKYSLVCRNAAKRNTVMTMTKLLPPNTDPSTM